MWTEKQEPINKERRGLSDIIKGGGKRKSSKYDGDDLGFLVWMRLQLSDLEV